MQLTNEYMNIYEYQSQGHGPRSLRFNIFKLSLRNHLAEWPIEARFHVEPPWDGETKVCSNGSGHLTNIAAMHIYGKNLNKFSSLEPKGR